MSGVPIPKHGGGLHVTYVKDSRKCKQSQEKSPLYLVADHGIKYPRSLFFFFFYCLLCFVLFFKPTGVNEIKVICILSRNIT